MNLDDYGQWANKETKALSSRAHEEMRGWAAGWGRAFRRLVEEDAVYEVCPLILARWEFLGCLFAGKPTPKSDMGNAIAYAREFLKPVNPRYMATHGSILSQRPVAGLVFEMLRNRSLHGFTPAGVFDKETKKCVAWAVKHKGMRSQHLQFVGKHASSILLDAETLSADLVASMLLFADHLESNQPTRRGLPVENFRVGFWWKLMPTHADKSAWGKLLTPQPARL